MDQEIKQVLSGHRQAIAVGKPSVYPRQQCCILPGSFDPLHHGHREMARIAELRCGLPVEFEISLTNVDKPPLGIDEVIARVQQFPNECVWLTRAPTFAEKAALFPKCTFVIGADTALRLFAERYYDSKSSVDQAMTNIRNHECRFLVFGRTIRGEFVSSAAIPLPAHIRDMFEFVPQESFDLDVSSTEIRRNFRSD